MNLSVAWKNQIAVVRALFGRELMSRFGTFKLGYFWALIDPLISIGIMCWIRVMMGSGDIAGLPFVLFFASGMLCFRIFSNIGVTAIGRVEGSISLMSYQRIKPFDSVIAKSLLEVAVSAISYIIIMGGLAMLGFTFEIPEPLLFVTSFSLMSCLAFGVGCLFAAISPFFAEFRKLAPILTLPLLFLSGVFFNINQLPETAREILLFNPILHAIELSRVSLFRDYYSPYVRLDYLIFSAMVSLFIGMALFRYLREVMITSGTIKLR